MPTTIAVDQLLSDNAKTVLQKRYLKKDERGEMIETPEQMFHRVAEAVAAADRLYDIGANVKATVGFTQFPDPCIWLLPKRRFYAIILACDTTTDCAYHGAICYISYPWLHWQRAGAREISTLGGPHRVEGAKARC